jgi:hypothetical protein
MFIMSDEIDIRRRLTATFDVVTPGGGELIVKPA